MLDTLCVAVFFIRSEVQYVMVVKHYAHPKILPLLCFDI